MNGDAIELETDSFPEAEIKYVGLCDAAHYGSVWRFTIGKHKLVEGQVKLI